MAYVYVVGLLAWLILLARLGPRPETTVGRCLDRAGLGRHWGTALRAAGLVALAVVWVELTIHHPTTVDATVYWSINLDDLYQHGHVNQVGAYLYSPAFAQVLAPTTFLPWPAWYSAWTALNLAALAWLVGPVAALPTLWFPMVGHALYGGNVHFLIAVAAVLAVRHPAAWTLPVLTKVTPGVGILWHAARGEWARLLRAMAWIGGIAAISMVAAPGLWSDWATILSQSAATPSPPTLLPLPLTVRIALGAAIVWIGGKRGWAWTIPVSMVLAQPVFWSAGLATLAAVVPLAHAASSGARPASIPGADVVA